MRGSEPAARTARTPEPGSPEALMAAAGNAAVAGLAEDGSFRVDLGRGIHFSASDLEGGRFDFGDDAPQPVPGLRLRSFEYRRNRGGTLRADLHVPLVENVRGGVQIRVDGEGRPSFQGTVEAGTRLGVFQDPRITLRIDEDRNISGTLSVGPSQLTPRALRGRLEVTGEGTIHLAEGRLSGSAGFHLTYPELGSGRLDLAFTESGQLSGSGHLEVTQPYLAGARAELAVEEGNVSAEVTIPAASLRPPIPALEITGGSVRLAMANTTPSGELQGVELRYAGLGHATLDARIQDGVFTGGGSLRVEISQVAEVSGRVSYDRQGRLSGEVTLRSRDFPESLPVRSGSLTARLRPDGSVDFSGQVGVSLGPAGTGELRGEWVEGRLSLGTTIDLEIPGLERTRFTLDYRNGELEGEGEAAVDPARLQGIGGSARVQYRNQLWAGETELAYEADDGKLSGRVRIAVRQGDDGALHLSGGGDVTARIAPRLEGTLQLVIHEDGTIDLSGAITVTEPLELFPEWRQDRELFRISRNIPLWAILVAVIRVRGGVRAGVGPGVFRDIRVEGEYTVGADESEPSLSISGEMYIPAFVEAYVAFGAGLGVSVVLGSLTGGIEGVASAGIYGAVSVVPVLSYRDGDYAIEGTATLAAGARLKVGLNAWAEIEALWITVWERTWHLAEWVWNVGPDLALQARMQYTFGNPEPPSIEFSTDDIDAERLIQDAMPKDGPPGSGAREALQNRAEWQGDLERQGREAGTVPAELEQQAAGTESPPDAPPRPPSPPRQGEAGGAPGGGGTGGPEAPSSDAATLEGEDGARALEEAASRPTGSEVTVTEGEIPTAGEPRYPGPVTLAILDEPPAPMPRTHEQQREDVEAAARVVELAAAQVDDTEGLAAYFPAIRRRFQLAVVAFQEMGGQIRVQLSANPEETVAIPGEVMKGSGIGGWVTEIRPHAGRLPGAPSDAPQVGLRMEAPRLGPDHPQGSPPGSGHDGLMALLAAPGSGVSAESGYIRGHLLNDNLGGPGTPENLFPITSNANAQHLSGVERQVKEWVNDERYWVDYRVEVRVDHVDLSHPAADRTLNRMDAAFLCTASLLTTDNRKVRTRSATVLSTYHVPQSADVADEEFLPMEEARRDAGGPDPLLSTRHGSSESVLDPGLYDALREARFTRGWTEIRERIEGTPGVGEILASTLLKAYGNAMGNGNTDQSSRLNAQERTHLSRLRTLAPAIIRRLREG
ncbi:MAG: hypothetical protein EA422_14480 [Gemmatimonadales bacterium]|nr:MAG: hypothetical protein EA422_14480 [Gemmatimonadales bacterium]